MLYIKRNLGPQNIICDDLYAGLDHMTSHDYDMTFEQWVIFSPQKLKIYSNKGMLHIK